MTRRSERRKSKTEPLDEVDLLGSGSPVGRSRRWFRMVVVGAVLLATGAWGSSIFIESPREAAARAAAPEPSLLSANAELKKVGDEVVTRGVVQATQTVEAISQVTPPGVDRALVSGRIPKVGDKVTAGAVVVEISGRPVIALVGSVPTYRSLEPESVGPDVVQLRAALTSLGFYSNDTAGKYGKSTKSAVQALYRRVGYSPPAGGGLPANEILYVSSLPASVVAIKATLGADVTQTSIEVASGELVVVAQVPSGQAPLIKAGAKVVVSAETIGKSVSGKIAGRSVAASSSEQAGPAEGNETAGEGSQPESTESSPPSDHSDSPDSPGPDSPGGADESSFVVVLNKDISGTWAGQDVRVRVISAQTEGKVLAVPIAAVFMDGNGNPQVIVVQGNARSLNEANPRPVRVTVGVTGGGWVQVEPVTKPSRLKDGAAVQLSATLDTTTGSG